MSRLRDLSGEKFGYLTAIKRADDYITKSGRHYVCWECLCDCGNTAIVPSDALIRGKTVSCGCYKSRITHERTFVHGMNHTKLYGVWCSMKARCFNEHTDAYKDYGGRGITVCDEWKNDFTKFLEWAMKNGYSDGLSIDRIDNNSGYFPENCRWVDRATQANNRRSNIFLTYNGVTHNIKEWSDITGINYQKIHHRVRYAGWSVERALTTK